MAYRNAWLLVVATSIPLLICVPSQATDRTYRVTFETTFTVGATSYTSEPYVLIQNPKDSGGSMTVDAVKIQWNDVDDLSLIDDGIWEHDGEGTCTALSSHALDAGEGLTVFLPAAFSTCGGVWPDCPETCTQGCGENCMELHMITPWGVICTCVPDFGTGTIPEPSRLTVVVEVDDGGYDEPLVRGLDALVSNAGTSSVVLEQMLSAPVEQE